MPPLQTMTAHRVVNRVPCHYSLLLPNLTDAVQLMAHEPHPTQKLAPGGEGRGGQQNGFLCMFKRDPGCLHGKRAAGLPVQYSWPRKRPCCLHSGGELGWCCWLRGKEKLGCLWCACGSREDSRPILCWWPAQEDVHAAHAPGNSRTDFTTNTVGASRQCLKREEEFPWCLQPPTVQGMVSPAVSHCYYF